MITIFRYIRTMKSFYVLNLLSVIAHPCFTVLFPTAVNSVTAHAAHTTFQERNLALKDIQRQKRIQKSRIGVKQMLVVKVSSSLGETAVESLDELEGAVYGSGSNPLNVPNGSSLVAQFKAVSHNQLIYEPAIDAKLTRPGILEIEVNVSTMMNEGGTSNRFDTIVRSAIMAEVDRVLGYSVDRLADRVLFCLPSGSLDKSVAGIGEVGGMFTFFHLGYCRKLDALMHELGHNLNFHHSGIGTQEYGDMSDYMGGLESPPTKKLKKLGAKNVTRPIDGAGFPLKAFNGHKHWTSGWFRNRSIEIYPIQTNQTIRQQIVSFVEYSNTALLPNEVVLVRCGTLYIQYNRAKGYNMDASEANKVTISEGRADGEVSVRVASLNKGEVYRHPNFEGLGKGLVIQVCSTSQEMVGVLDYADIRIYVDDGIQRDPCFSNEGVDAGDYWVPESLLVKIEDQFRSLIFIFVLSGAMFVVCAYIILCLIRSRYYFADKKIAGEASMPVQKHCESDVAV